MSETQNNIIRFNYSVDPTTLMSNSWITTNTDTTQNTVTGVGSYYWRTITFTFVGKGEYSGVFKVEVDEEGVPVSPINFESISGDVTEWIQYLDEFDTLYLYGATGGGACTKFSTAVPNQTYTETEPDGTWSYTASTTTETDDAHYEVELYVNSDVITFPNNLFYQDENITSVEFDTYSIISIEDGSKSSGAFFDCGNLVSIILPNNIEYIGDYFAGKNNGALKSIILPSTVEEIGSNAFDRVYVECYAINPPILHSSAFVAVNSLTIHETALQSYINSDWLSYVTSIGTIETPTYGNVLKFNHSTDPTTLLNNLWVNSCTDTSANTIVGIGEHTETGYMSYSELEDLEIQWTPKQEAEATKEEKVIDASSASLSEYLMFIGWTESEVNGFISIYGGDAKNAYIICYAETGSRDYEDIMALIDTTVTTYDHYEVTLYINSALNTFETTMFKEDENITSVEFDYNVTSIIDDAFNGCENLSSVTLTSTVPPTIGEDTFSLISHDAVLYVPTASIPAYQTAGFGDYFGEIRGTSPVPPKRSGFNVSGMIDTDYIIEVYKRR